MRTRRPPHRVRQLVDGTVTIAETIRRPRADDPPWLRETRRQWRSDAEQNEAEAQRRRVAELFDDARPPVDPEIAKLFDPDLSDPDPFDAIAEWFR